METYEHSAPAEVKALKAVLDEVQNSDDWKWSINKMDPKIKAERDKKQKAFKARYK